MNKITSIILLISVMMFASCSKYDRHDADSKDEASKEVYTKEIGVEIAPLTDENETKVLMKNKEFQWYDGDKISVWPLSVTPGQSSQQIEFTLKGGSQSKTAVFEGTGWALICDGSHKYYSYYPYDSTGTQTCATITYPELFSIRQRWDGQSVITTSKVGQYMYMYAPQIQPARPDSASFSFKHISCLAVFEIEFPSSAVGKTASKITISTISANDSLFTLEAQYDPSIITSDSSPVVFTRTKKTNVLRVGINNGVQIKSEPVKFPLPMLPASLQGKRLIIMAETKSGDKFEAIYNCSKNQQPGTFYTYPVSNLEEHIPVSPKDSVDMGKGLYWATVNYGAEAPEEAGYSLNWGTLKSDPQGKWDVYKFGDYKRLGVSQTADPDPAYAPDYGLTKYNYTDHKTVLELTDDAVAQSWGDGWRMPTKKEFEDLLKNSDISDKTELNGVSGWYIYNKNDRSKFIFLPAYYYWTSTLSDYSTANISAWSVVGTRARPFCYAAYPRTNLMSMRPVKEIK